MIDGLHVESFGSGPPLVLLHGWAMHSGVWGDLPARLGSRFRVHAVDLPGHGFSAPIMPLTLDAMVDVVAAHPAVIETLVQRARSYIFTTAAPPLLATALRASLALIRSDRARHDHLFALIARFREQARGLPWQLLPSSTAIQPLIVGGNTDTLELSAALWQRGMWVPAIRPPTVPQGTARLRITLSAAHTQDDVDTLTSALADLAHERSR